MEWCCSRVTLSYNEFPFTYIADSLRSALCDFHINNARTSLNLRYQRRPLLGAGNGKRILGKTALNGVARLQG